MSNMPDVAGQLFTTTHRNVKLAGKEPPSQNTQGVGSCFDTTMLSPTRPGAHKPVHLQNGEMPYWSKSTLEYR
ncbi:hypothetical protein DUNSADRAFT_7719 [Dunaliella salina]|uniref:Encoded protein n=1 Tax=Dunaliella salina TaxID=3046 RepID=A0ABQ7GKU7_DUNSA|nr:hypothetical protein DUNSADRAFT_7719 [Dunaliella salina]|eukprot:KAF5835230.1 hypothetical protein DUNSADRAFT_7719 [Dunaliella salina]